MPAKDTKKGTVAKVAAKATKVVSKIAKKGAAAVKGGKTAAPKPKGNRFAPLFVKKTKNFSVGNDIQPKRDLTRFVRWPRYIRVQRQRRILMKRLKVPPTIHQFTRTLDVNNVAPLLKLLNKYRPERAAAKKARLVKIAKARAAGKTEEAPKKPLAVAFGTSEVVSAIESKRAKLVVIAHDVNPIELVVYLPTLCRKMDIPYVIIKSRARLGTVVHRKTCSALAVVDVHKEHRQDLATIAGLARELFNDNAEHRKQWGGGILSGKSLAVIAKQQKAVARERSTK